MEVTMDLILSVFKNNKDSKRLREIKTAVVEVLSQSDGEIVLLSEEEIESIGKAVENIIKDDIKNGEESLLKYSKSKYQKRPNRRPPQDPNKPTSIYVGTAGEAAVMSELMFNGYNANRMMIDDGVDIVASKNNIYFYIQVKTTYVDNGRIYCRINDISYDRYIQAQMRYVIVARYNENGIDRNMFFVFNNQDIDREIYNKCIKKSDGYIYIKIKFNPQSGAPYLYDERESDISYQLNNFKLI